MAWVGRGFKRAVFHRNHVCFLNTLRTLQTNALSTIPNPSITIPDPKALETKRSPFTYLEANLPDLRAPNNFHVAHSLWLFRSVAIDLIIWLIMEAAPASVEDSGQYTVYTTYWLSKIWKNYWFPKTSDPGVLNGEHRPAVRKQKPQRHAQGGCDCRHPEGDKPQPF